MGAGVRPYDDVLAGVCGCLSGWGSVAVVGTGVGAKLE